jgi:fimbrial chaperone protein
MTLFGTRTLAAAIMFAGLPMTAGAQDAPAASAQDRAVQVSLAPLRIEMAGTTASTVLRVANPSGREVGVQVRAFGWSQRDGADVYSASDDVMITPSIIQIAPGQTQVFRVVRRAPASPGEKRFRIAVDQLPDPELESAGEAQARIRFTIPLFLDRDQAAPVDLAWTLDGSGLQARNAGGQTVRIVGVALADATGTAIPLEKNSLRYLQGGSAIAWPLAGACPGGPVDLTATIDGTTVHAQVPARCG